MRRYRLLLLLGLAFLVPWMAMANWPRWRGPEGTAVSPARGLPVTWNTTEHVRWKASVPGLGFSSPIVWEDDVYLTAALEQGSRRLMHALDRCTGQLRWTRELADKNPERASAMTGHAASTPVTDGRHVVAFFGNAGVVCFDRSGRQLWHRALGEFDSELGLATSPILHEDRVILVCDHDGDRFTSFDSYLLALDVHTGATVWKTERRGLFRSWSTPIVVTDARGDPLLIVNGQDHLRAYDPRTGQERWQVAGMTGWVAPSPVFGHGLIFATSGKNGPVLAVRPDGQVVWKKEGAGPYVCSPLLHGDHLYVHNEQGILTCFEARTGAIVYRERLPGKFTASAVAGDGKLYFTNEDGLTLVVQAGTTFTLLARNALDEYTLASPAIAGSDLFVRTEKHLYCIQP